MATRQMAAGDDPGAPPVACALTITDLAAQAQRWKQLMTRALIERAETALGLRLSFRPEAGVAEELSQLVAVENECCAWATWTVHRASGRVTLDVRSAGDGVAALHTMFTSAG